jgi:1-acyl-sn-glycerol-3-phosphate acyltransferase
MSSTRPSSPSSTADSLQPGPEYREAATRAPDPLLHLDPYRPPWLYRIVFGILRLLVRLLFRFSVEGLENLPGPPYLIASNHQAWYDTAFIVAAFPKLPMIYTMARRDTVFNRRWKRALVPLFGVFPIQPHQGQLDEGGVASVYHVLQRGGVVLIFPEGRYSRGHALQTLRKGVGHFALQAAVPICPVALSGTERLRPFGRVQISIRPSVWPNPPPALNLNTRVTRILENVRRAILGGFEREEAQRRRPGRMRRLSSRLRGPMDRQQVESDGRVPASYPAEEAAAGESGSRRE